MVEGESLCWYVKGVPHDPQKVRRTGGEERNSVGWPRVNSKRVAGNVIQATTGEAAARRQVRQWQIMLFAGSPVTR